MIEEKVDTATAPPKSSGPESPAFSSALSEGRINPNAHEILNRIYRLMNMQMFMPELKYRLAATAMICNKIGILAGQAGSQNGEPILRKTNEKRYRKSEPPKGAPTVNLSFDLTALQNEAMVMQAAPEYGESELFSGYRSAAFDTPVTTPKSAYKTETGPPTAPHYEHSHVITNYVVYGSEESNGFSLQCGWEDIRRDKDDFFEKLIAPEKGRDLRGATTYDEDQLVRQVMAWAAHLATGQYNV